MPGEREQPDGALSEDRAYPNPLGFLGCLWASGHLSCEAGVVSLATELWYRASSAGALAAKGEMQPTALFSETTEGLPCLLHVA